jgi:thiamine biosynthesis lipoprotein
VSASCTFPLWSTSVTVVADEPSTLAAATDVVRAVLDRVDAASSRFRDDSELSRLRPGVNHASETLADLVGRALDVARDTDGLVDPTIGGALVALGYDRSIESIESIERDRPTVTVVPEVPGWRAISLEGRLLRMPAGVALDLGATAKARAADLAAGRASERTGAAVLVGIGGDIATSGTGPDAGWQILVRDTDEDPACQVTLAGGRSIATSSTVRRTWRRGGRALHHIVDPRTAAPAVPVWRSVTVSAATCVEANAASTAAVVLGHRAIAWLTERGCAARLVDQQRRVVRTAGWPAEVAA